MTDSDFLDGAGGWTIVRPLACDGSSRRYLRAKNSAGKTAVLMHCPPDSSPLSTPGHKISDFLRLANALRDSGLHAPQIYAADPDTGYVLMEDFGDVSFHKALNAGVKPETLYTLAADVLARLHTVAPVPPLADYFKSHVHTARRRIVDWFVPVQKGRLNPDGLAEDYLATWDAVQSTLPPPACGFLHVDFHVDNLMWIEEDQGLAKCGLLDFQGALHGPIAYDLANLLGDMRYDVPDAVCNPVLSHFCAGMTKEEAHSVLLWRAVLSTQFHGRLAGQIIRWALVGGKPGYMSYLPRVLHLLRADLTDPLVAPVARWFAENDVDLSGSGDINPLRAHCFIRSDAV